jgi:hypothetical protein
MKSCCHGVVEFFIIARCDDGWRKLLRRRHVAPSLSLRMSAQVRFVCHLEVRVKGHQIAAANLRRWWYNSIPILCRSVWLLFELCLCVSCVRPSTCPLFQPHLRSERACWWYFCNAQFNGYEFSLRLCRPLAVAQFERTKRSSRRAGKMSWAIPPPPLFRIVFSVSRCNCVEPLVAVCFS